MTEAQEIFTTEEAANFIRYRGSTMQVWRSQAKGPVYFKIGGTVRYRRADLQQWLIGGDAARDRIDEYADCHREQRGKTKRLRGRLGTEQRQRRLIASPLCRECAAYGFSRAAEEIDHIVPLARGGTDTDDNVQSLCKSCHKARTSSMRKDILNTSMK